MLGKAHNPKGFEPDLHGELTKPPKEVMDLYSKLRAGKMASAQRFTYAEEWEYVKRGEADAMGHYVYEMMYDIYPGIEDEIMNGAI